MTVLKRLLSRKKPVLLCGVAYEIGELVPIEHIPALARDPQRLAAYQERNFRTYAHSSVSLAEQAVRSAKKTLAAAHLAPADIDAIVIGTSEIVEPRRFPETLSTDILNGLGRADIPVVGVTLAGCANYGSAVRVARNMVVAEELAHVLVIETDQARGAMERAVDFEGAPSLIFGDGAASVVVSAEEARAGTASRDFEVVGMAQTVKPLDWDGADDNTIALNTMLGWRHVLDEAFAGAGITPDQLAQTFFSNINIRAVHQVASMLSLPHMYTANCSRTAHVWSCDNLINMTDYCAAERVAPGALFLLLCHAETYFSAIVCRSR